MRINENKIIFRNEVNLLNPIEMLNWVFNSDWIDGYSFKVYGIRIKSNFDFRKLNNIQIKELKKFIDKHKNNLPVGLIYIFDYFYDDYVNQGNHAVGGKE